MLTSVANFSVQTTLWTWIRLLLGEQLNLDPHCLLQRLDWNNLAEHKWRFAGMLMMAQHCWLSSVLIFQGILISIAKKPNISYDFSGRAPPPPPNHFVETTIGRIRLLGQNRPTFLTVFFRITSDHHQPMRFTGAGGGWTGKQTDRYVTN